MRKHVLFIIHGMGVYVNTTSKGPDHTWSKKAASALKEQYEKYAVPKLVAFEKRFGTLAAYG